jgi:hypothetical protein
LVPKIFLKGFANIMATTTLGRYFSYYERICSTTQLSVTTNQGYF